MALDASIVSLNLRVPRTRTATATAEFPLDVGSRTDPGRVRENNEDCLLVAPKLNLFALSDGMGGLACGEVASRMTVDTLLDHCQEAYENPALAVFGKCAEGVNDTSRRLASAIQLANRIVYRAAHEKGSARGMGATVVAVRYAKDRLTVAHIGDSRAYRLREGRFEQLTRDHSFAAEQVRLGQLTEDEAYGSGLRNILTRAVGVEPEVEVEISEERLLAGDVILLCSDGLTHELSDKQIASVLRDAKNAQEAAARLVDLANRAGGADNITAIVLRQPGGLSRKGALSRWFSR